ncbi:hypothetical protein AtEden1_Chr2g0228261 [Arabidopsis thaliana]
MPPKTMPPLKKRKRGVGTKEKPAPATKPIVAVTKATAEPPTTTEEPSLTEQDPENVEEEESEEEEKEEEETEEEEEEEGEEEEEEEEEKEEEENVAGEESSDDSTRSLGEETSADENMDEETSTAVEIPAAMEIDEETEAVPPLSMYFPPSEYVKKIKLSTRCYIHEVLTTFDKLEPPMSKSERSWFENHPSFQHIFHMPRDPNHRLMGMWMLLLRTVHIERKKKAWFIVNGVPIRYGILEHALISGFNCKNHKLGFKNTGNLDFKRKHFKDTVVKREDVREKLIGMVPTGERSKERLRMMVLYFLSSIIIAPIKTGDKAPQVDEFCLKVVSDLTFCRNFQWGRYSLDYMLGTISHTVNHFNGSVTNNEKYIWPVPGFCLPMELLAFEAIPQLREKFIEEIAGADPGCPRMCKVTFKKNHLKGFPLDTIYAELGTTRVIDSIVTP